MGSAVVDPYRLETTVMRTSFGSACVGLIAILGLLSGIAAEGGTPPKVGPGRLSLKLYGPDQGLANPVVWSLAADPHGFVWAGTEDGLFRFDGGRFRGYFQKDGLPVSLVEHILFEPDGTLWIGTYSGLARKDPSGIHAVGPSEGIPTARIIGLGRSANGSLWVATGEGVFLRDARGRFAVVPGWPGGRVSALAVQDSPSSVWVGYTQHNRFGVRRWQNGTWDTPRMDPEPPEEITAMAVGKTGSVWARTINNLWSYNAGDGGFVAVSPAVPSAGREPSLYVDPLNRLWVPNLQGILCIDGDTREQWTEREGFTPKLIHAMLMDPEGSMWFGGNDLFRRQAGGIFFHYQKADGLPDSGVWCALRDPAGRLVVGTDGGLAVSNEQGFDAVLPTLGFQVRSAALGPDGAIYATGHPAVIRWDPVTNTVRRFGVESGFDPGGRSFRLQFDRDGVLWVATEGSGLMRGTLQSGRLRFVRAEVPGGNDAERFTDLSLDAEGRLWAAGAQGLAVRDGDTWHRFTTRDGLLSNAVAFVRSLSDGSIATAYFGAPSITSATYAGGVFTVTGNYDHVFPTEQVVYMMGEDARRNFWVGTGQGVNVLLANGETEHFGRNEGLASENISNMSFFAEPDGTVWFGTTGGLHRFDAHVYRGSAPPPRAAILEVRFGTDVRSGEDLTYKRIPANANTVEMSVASPSNIREGSVVHDVRLVGFENEWHHSANREERYPKLPPGNYTFEVKARIGQGAFGPPASWSFTILPAWWQTWWFRALTVLAGLAIIGWAVHWRMRSLQRRNLLLEGTVAARTAELHDANAQLRDQSLTDPLTGLRNRRYLGTCMVEDSAQALRRRIEVQAGRSERLKTNIDILFLMIDLDHFKTVNDTYGHQAGDHVLKQAADVIRSATRNSDTVVRWGGEEFLVVARGTSRQHADTLAERIRSMMEQYDFEVEGGQTVHVTCSLGFATFPMTVDRPNSMTWELVVNLADRCMYSAKRSGRNAWVGLVGAEGLKTDADVNDLCLHLEDHVASGIVQMVSSLPPGTPLEWTLRADA